MASELVEPQKEEHSHDKDRHKYPSKIIVHSIMSIRIKFLQKQLISGTCVFRSRVLKGCASAH
jgi:hypothetical protein